MFWWKKLLSSAQGICQNDQEALFCLLQPIHPEYWPVEGHQEHWKCGAGPSQWPHHSLWCTGENEQVSWHLEACNFFLLWTKNQIAITLTMNRWLMVFLNVYSLPRVKQSLVFLSDVFIYSPAFKVCLFICAWLPLLQRLQDVFACGCWL